MRSSLFFVAMLLAVAFAVAAQSPNGPPAYQPYKETSCWECHSPASQYEAPMEPFVALTPEISGLGASGELELNTIISSVWIGAKGGDQELYGWRATLDISDAPSFSFVSDQEPYGPESKSGKIELNFAPYEPTPGVALPADPEKLLDPQYGHVTVPIPSGATTATLRVIPANSDPRTGADIMVDVYPGVTSPTGSPYNDEPWNEAGRGQPEILAFSSKDFGGMGYGDWTIDVGYIPANASGEITPPVPVEFTVEVTAEFATSDATQLTQTDEASITGGQSILMPWPVVVNDPQPGEVLHFTLNMTMFYKHGSQGAEFNWADFQVNIDVPITEAPDGSVQFGTTQDGIVVPGIPTGPSIAAISEIVGYIGAFLLVASVWTGGMFGKTSRRQLNVIFGSARRRVAFHNFLSYGIIAFAIMHTAIFAWDLGGPLAGDGFHWLVGLLWGGQAILGMFLLGVTGALQVPMIRKWNYGTWRWIHFGLAIGTILFVVTHILLDGSHFTDFQARLGWDDPIVPANR